MHARRDCHSDGAYGFPAADIMHGVADHDNIGRSKFHLQLFFGFLDSPFGKLNAAICRVAVQSERKIPGKPYMIKLPVGNTLSVPRKNSQYDIVSSVKANDQITCRLYNLK